MSIAMKDSRYGVYAMVDRAAKELVEAGGVDRDGHVRITRQEVYSYADAKELTGAEREAYFKLYNYAKARDQRLKGDTKRGSLILTPTDLFGGNGHTGTVTAVKDSFQRRNP